MSLNWMTACCREIDGLRQRISQIRSSLPIRKQLAESSIGSAYPHIYAKLHRPWRRISSRCLSEVATPVARGTWGSHRFIRKLLLASIVKLEQNARRLPARKLLYNGLGISRFLFGLLPFLIRLAFRATPMFLMLAMMLLPLLLLGRRTEITLFMMFLLFLAISGATTAVTPSVPIPAHI